MGNLTTVDEVDINRYMGTWYEISKIPNRFQKNCIGNTTANYTLLQNGDVEVLNSCLDKSGKIKEAKGIARVADEKTKSRLKVSFFSIFGIHLFWGDYWIIYLDDNYEKVIVGEPGRKYGWILSRKPELTSEELEPLYKVLIENGYNPRDFEHTTQNITK